MIKGTKEYGHGEFTFPRGWFMVSDTGELTDKPLPVRFWGQDFVLYRGKSGKVVMLDAYCPHMGTHLGHNTTSYVVQDGQIEGDSIRCPYHAWRFGADGKCDHIPYYDGPIPKAAAVRSHPVQERYGCIFAWHDPEGQAPDMALPEIPEWDDASWVKWNVVRLGVIDCHPTEVIDNMADLPHLGPVHGAPVEYFENEFKGHVCIQRQGGFSRWLNGVLETDTRYTGPAILTSYYRGPFNAVTFICNTPVDDGTTRVWTGTMVKAANFPVTDADVKLAREQEAASVHAFSQDFEIWNNKAPAVNILQIPTDGPFDKNRLWYKQFYNPRARQKDFIGRIEGVHFVKGMPSQAQFRAAAAEKKGAAE